MQQGDVLLSHINSIAHIGKVARMDSNRPLIHGMNLMALRFSKRIDSSFGFAVLSWQRTKRFMETRAKKAVNQASINRQDINELPILLPPLPEQRAIAAVLDSLDEAIERTEEVIAATERLRDALLHELLTRGVPGWHRKWWEAPGIGTIPVCWDVVQLGDVARLRDARAPNRNETPQPYIGLEHIANGGHLEGLGSESDYLSGKTRFLKGDTLYGKLRPNLRKVLRAPFDGTCTTEILALYGGAQLDSGFLSHALRRDVLHRYAMTGITGTKMPRTSWGHLSQFRLALPHLPEQQSVAALLDGVDETIEQARMETEMLQLLKESAADALLTGRVRVLDSARCKRKERVNG